MGSVNVNERPFFSIIMPVYNSAEYLKQAIDSIINQTFVDFELIIIDDCSSDESYEICKSYSEHDSRIKLIKNQKNSGASIARNRGIDIANGKYCGFVDSDDYIEHDLLNSAYAVLMRSNVDFLKFGVYEEYYSENGILVNCPKFSPGNFISTNRNEIYSMIVQLELVPLFGYMCNSFYINPRLRNNKKMVKLNPKIRINEDFDYNIRWLENVECFQCIDYCGYHYAKRVNDSMSTKDNANYYDDHMRKIRSFIDLYDGIEKMPAVVRRNVFWLYTKYAFSSMVRIMKDDDLSRMIDKITEDNLYNEFLKTRFEKISMKQKIMINVLRSNNKKLLKFISFCIRKIRSKMPIIFSKIKR